MSYLTGATNAQSLNGILTITDGVITISEGTISGLEEIDLNDLQVADTATIQNLVVNNQIDMTLGQIKNVSAPTDDGDAVNKQFVDTNFLNKVITISQSVASRLTFNNATSSLALPIISFTNATTGINSGMYLRFWKNFARLPSTEIGGITFADNVNGILENAVQLTASISSVSTPVFDIKFNGALFNPLTIRNTQTILRNDDLYLLKKDGAQLFYYTSLNDFWAMSKSLNMTTNNITNVNSLTINNQIDMTDGKIINLAEPSLAQDASTKNYTDTHSNNGNYLLRNGTLPMTGNLQMGSFKITNLLDPSDLNDGANKYYVDTQSANTHYLLRNGTLAMTGNLSLASHNLTTTGDINCNEVTADGNINTTADMSCADFNSAGNQVIGGGSLNVLDVKSSAFFEANVLIETNKHLAFNSGTLSTTNGMLMNYDGGVGFLDVRGSEFRVRTASSGTPSNIRFKVNHTNTTVLNNFFCDADCTFGSDTATDEARFNCKATFPSGSDLRFNDGADIIYDSGAESIFSSGSITQFNYGSTLRFLNIQSFNVGSYINSARINLIRKTSDFTLNYLTNFENGVISDPNSSGLIITMPDTGGPSGASGLYWNRRHYIIKLKDGGQTKLRQNTTTISTKIDENTGDINYNTAWKTIQLVFDENFSGNGQIYIISDR